jgi:hypothetical protein
MRVLYLVVGPKRRRLINIIGDRSADNLVEAHLMTRGFVRLSGYILLPWLLITIHLAGAWSEWMVGHTTFATSLIAYTIAPTIVLISVYARMR